MKNKLMENYIKISRVTITIMIFIVLNAWFIFENDPQWIISLIISIVVFFTSFPSSKICKFIINKGDKITNKLHKVLYYFLILPFTFFLIIILVALLYSLGVFLIGASLNIGLAILIAYIGIGTFTCILVPYFQTLIILVLRHLNKK